MTLESSTANLLRAFCILSKEVDFQTKPTLKSLVQFSGTPILFLSSRPTSSPKPRWTNTKRGRGNKTPYTLEQTNLNLFVILNKNNGINKMANNIHLLLATLMTCPIPSHAGLPPLPLYFSLSSSPCIRRMSTRQRHVYMYIVYTGLALS